MSSWVQILPTKMKRIVLILVSAIALMDVHSQDSMEKTMEFRAKELHRVLSLTGMDLYKKFMQENYTKAFLEKPIKLNRNVSDSDGGGSSESKELSNLDAKAQMFVQLHEDFGGSKLGSLKRKDNEIMMILTSPSGLVGTFNLTFDKESPYKIDRLGVQAEMGN